LRLRDRCRHHRRLCRDALFHGSRGGPRSSAGGAGGAGGDRRIFVIFGRIAPAHGTLEPFALGDADEEVVRAEVFGGHEAQRGLLRREDVGVCAGGATRTSLRRPRRGGLGGVELAGGWLVADALAIALGGLGDLLGKRTMGIVIIPENAGYHHQIAGADTPPLRAGEEAPSPFSSLAPCGGVPADHNGLALVPVRASPPGCPVGGKVSLDKVLERFVCQQHWVDPVSLFNH
jgi:hypothetical protein